MNILVTIRYALMILRTHKHIVAPSVIVSLTLTILSIVFIINPSAMTGGGSVQTVKDLEPFMGRLITLGVLDFLVQIFTQAMVVSMAMDIIDKKECSIRRGFMSVLSRANAILYASIILGILLFSGMLLLFIPAVIIAYFLMFTIVALMSDPTTDTVTAMKLSYMLVRRNLNWSMMVFLSLIGIGLIITLFNVFLSNIQGFGQIIPSITIGLYMAFVAIILLLAYRELIHHEYTKKINRTNI